MSNYGKKYDPNKRKLNKMLKTGISRQRKPRKKNNNVTYKQSKFQKQDSVLLKTFLILFVIMMVYILFL